MYGVANDHTLTGHTNIWVLANLPTLFYPVSIPGRTAITKPASWL
jgi:hypothetical protein